MAVHGGRFLFHVLSLPTVLQRASGQFAGTLVAVPTQMQWQASVLLLEVSRVVAPSRMQWVAGAGVSIRGTQVTPARLQWVAPAQTVRRGGGLHGRYYLGMQRGYPRRMMVVV